jgi:hypothetical protein
VKDEALAESVAEMPAPSDRLAAAATPSTELHDLAQSTELGATAAGGEPAAAPAGQDQAASDPLLVVRVHAKRAALETRTFDRLLERSGIEVEPDATNESVTDNFAESRRAARRFVQNGQTDGVAAEPATGQPAEAASVDAVLVEAPPAAIMACMDGLNKDQENFLGLVVDETAAAEAKSAAIDAIDPQFLNKQKLAEDLELSKYNRGIVPPEPESLARDKFHYYRSDGANLGGGGFGGGRFGGAYADDGRFELLQQDQQDRLLRARKALTESQKGLAVRLREWGSESAQQPSQSLAQQTVRGGLANEDARADSDAAAKLQEEAKLQELGREMKEAEQRAADNKLQVLFLFSSEEPAAAPATPRSRGKAQ